MGSTVRVCLCEARPGEIEGLLLLCGPTHANSYFDSNSDHDPIYILTITLSFILALTLTKIPTLTLTLNLTATLSHPKNNCNPGGSVSLDRAP